MFCWENLEHRTRWPLFSDYKRQLCVRHNIKRNSHYKRFTRLNDINEYLGRCDSAKLVSAEDLFETSMQKNSDLSLLAPCDFQAIKACGVTFAKSMVERVIEERAAGDPKKAESLKSHWGVNWR